MFVFIVFSGNYEDGERPQGTPCPHPDFTPGCVICNRNFDTVNGLGSSHRHLYPFRCETCKHVFQTEADRQIHQSGAIPLPLVEEVMLFMVGMPDIMEANLSLVNVMK